MKRMIGQIFAALIGINKYERLKVLLLALTYLCIVAGYTIIYDLKNSIFMSIVGREYVPYAKMTALLVLIPGVLFYSFLVDRLRRYQLIYFYSIVYSVFGLCCAYFVGHPTIGVANTDGSPWRLFGWVFFFFVEGFSPFMISIFWSFSNSITDPESAKDSYGFLVAGSKLGGMISAGLSMCLLALKDVHGKQLLSDALNHQILLLIFSCVVLLVPCVIYLLMKKIPGFYLHGYKAVYELEKEKISHEEKSDKHVRLNLLSRVLHAMRGMFSGLLMIMRRPYIFGIFGMIFFYETLSAVLSYKRLAVAQSVSNSVSDISSLLYSQMFVMHMVGFMIALFGTRALLRWLGEATCLVLIPITSGIFLIYFWATFTPFSLLLVFVISKSVNYAFSYPVREALYIPTVKDVKFKSKAWIDGPGQKISRSTGSLFNIFSDKVAPWLLHPLQGVFFMVIIFSWVLTALFLGKKYVKTVESNEAIT
jgi:ATP:ADP antiporter, AAA family